MNVPRLRGNEGEVGDMWSYFETYEKQPNLKFVSDGNPNILTVTSNKKDLINIFFSWIFDVINGICQTYGYVAASILLLIVGYFYFLIKF